MSASHTSMQVASVMQLVLHTDVRFTQMSTSHTSMQVAVSYSSPVVLLHRPKPNASGVVGHCAVPHHIQQMKSISHFTCCMW
jgi:hypothetical protein